MGTGTVDIQSLNQRGSSKRIDFQTYPDGGYGFLSDASFVMGYNEPDMYGPACDGDWNPPAYGCVLGGYRPATSSGFPELFDPASAAKFWQNSINNMTANTGNQLIVSPSMAMGAEPNGTCVGVDPTTSNMKHCPGWLQMFKKYALTKHCTDFSGKSTNCWDVIDVIQIHAYARDAQDVKDKISSYHAVFQEDFDGSNGRNKKTLWLTEVAAGTNDGSKAVQFVEDLMNPTDGLTNRDTYGFVEKVFFLPEFSV